MHCFLYHEGLFRGSEKNWAAEGYRDLAVPPQKKQER